MLSVLQTANDGSGLGFILIALLVCTPLGGILFVLVMTLLGSSLPQSSSSYNTTSSDNSDAMGNSFEHYPYGSKCEQINAEFAEQQAKRDKDWEDR